MKSHLDSRVSEFLKEQAAVKKRRELWNSSVKKNLKDHLEYSVEKYSDISWYIEGHNDLENYESVYLAISNVPSGIKDEKGNLLMLMGGAVHFSQIHNGKVRVWMQYPEIPDLVQHNPNYEVFDDVEPNDLLDKIKLENFIALFLIKQIEAKPEIKPRPIGFH